MVLAQQPGPQFRRHMDRVDVAVQPVLEQPIDERISAGHIFERPRGIRHVLRLHMVAGRDGQALGTRRGERVPPEFEWRVDVHDVHAVERAIEQRGARLRELHLLFRRHPADERHPVDLGRVLGRVDAHEAHTVPLPFQLLSPLQRRIRRPVAAVAEGVHHHGDRQWPFGGLLRAFAVLCCTHGSSV